MFKKGPGYSSSDEDAEVYTRESIALTPRLPEMTDEERIVHERNMRPWLGLQPYDFGKIPHNVVHIDLLKKKINKNSTVYLPQEAGVSVTDFLLLLPYLFSQPHFMHKTICTPLQFLISIKTSKPLRTSYLHEELLIEWDKIPVAEPLTTLVAEPLTTLIEKYFPAYVTNDKEVELLRFQRELRQVKEEVQAIKIRLTELEQVAINILCLCEEDIQYLVTIKSLFLETISKCHKKIERLKLEIEKRKSELESDKCMHWCKADALLVLSFGNPEQIYTMHQRWFSLLHFIYNSSPPDGNQRAIRAEQLLRDVFEVLEIAQTVAKVQLYKPFAVRSDLSSQDQLELHPWYQHVAILAATQPQKIAIEPSDALKAYTEATLIVEDTAEKEARLKAKADSFLSSDMKVLLATKEKAKQCAEQAAKAAAKKPFQPSVDLMTSIMEQGHKFPIDKLPPDLKDPYRLMLQAKSAAQTYQISSNEFKKAHEKLKNDSEGCKKAFEDYKKASNHCKILKAKLNQDDISSPEYETTFSNDERFIVFRSTFAFLLRGIAQPNVDIPLDETGTRSFPDMSSSGLGDRSARTSLAASMLGRFGVHQESQPPKKSSRYTRMSMSVDGPNDFHPSANGRCSLPVASPQDHRPTVTQQHRWGLWDRVPTKEELRRRTIAVKGSDPSRTNGQFQSAVFGHAKGGSG